MSMVIDVILVALILLVVYKAYSKGFVATFLETFSVFISGIVSFALCGTVADSAYNMFVKDLVKTEFARALDEISGSAPIKDKVTAMLDALPKPAIGIAEYTGVNLEYLKSTLWGLGSASNEELIELVADKVAYDLMIGVIEVIAFLGLFILVSLLVRMLSSFFSHIIEKIPVVGGMDSLLGIVFGLVKACVILLAVGVLLSVIVATAGGGSPLLAIEESKIYGFLTGFNPILEL